jgi:hypothetical protein
LTFGGAFNLKSLVGVTFPSTLQSLTLGDGFNQSLQGVTFPRSLQTLVLQSVSVSCDDVADGI